MKNFSQKSTFLLKCAIFSILAIFLCFGMAACADMNEYAVISENNLSSEGLYYTLYENNTAVVTGIADTSKKTVTIPKKIDSAYAVTAIGEGAFESNEALQYVVIEDGPAKIDRDAFRKCYNLLRIDIPASVKEIGNYAFESCEKLCEVVGIAKVNSFGTGAFYQCLSLSVIDLPDTLRTVGDECFFGCTALAKAVLPQKIETVGFGAFAQCTALTSVDLGGLTLIPDAMFERDESLLKIEIGGKVTSIGERAFRACKNLSEVSIGKKVAYIGGSAFEGTTWLLNQSDEFVVVGDGVLLKYNGKGSDVVVPNNVKVISDAFSGINKLESVTIGGKVNVVAEYAFSGCVNLKKVVLTGKVSSVENCAFLGCIALESVEFPKTLMLIGDNAFGNCTALKEVIYNGSSEDWYKIPVGKGNYDLQAVQMTFK